MPTIPRPISLALLYICRFRLDLAVAVSLTMDGKENQDHVSWAPCATPAEEFVNADPLVVAVPSIQPAPAGQDSIAWETRPDVRFAEQCATQIHAAAAEDIVETQGQWL